MRKELDEELCKKYPKIFRDRHGDMRSTAMCWGFDCGDGWYNILDKMCAIIQGHINNTRAQRVRALLFNRALGKAMRGDMSSYNRLYWYQKKEIDERLKDPEPQCEQVPRACPQVIATQVKEKFGTLRFYYWGGDEYCSGVESMAESMSAVTCEVCGSPGMLRQGGWIRALCDEHAKEAGYEEEQK
jgi:hypothetical protein